MTNQETLLALESTEADLEKWRLVFVRSRADFITVDGWVSRSAREQVQRAVGNGWLEADDKTSNRESDEQYTAACFRPTDKLWAALRTQANEQGEG